MTTYYVAYQYRTRHGDGWGCGFMSIRLPEPVTTANHVDALRETIVRVEGRDMDGKPIIINWIELTGDGPAVTA